MALDFYPSNFENLIEQMQASMDESHAEDLNLEMRPILEKLSVVGLGENKDAVIRQLSSWLKDENRTVEELNYVVGPLGNQVYNKYMTAEGILTEIRDNIFAYLALEVAEVLVMKSPVLEGPWQHTAWFVLLRNILLDDSDTVSNNFCEWIICMMGNSDLCPNPYLRLEFLKVFGSEECFINNNQMQAFESVMFACSTLHSIHMKEFIYSEDYGDCMYLRSIIKALEKVGEDEYWQTFDQQLYTKLLIQMSVYIKDKSCLYGLNPNRNTYIYEINIITNLFETTSAYAQQELKKLLVINADPVYQMDNMEDISEALLVLITYFKKSCQTPQLINVTALCIIDVVEVTILFCITMLTMYPHRAHPEFDPACLSNTDKLLGKLSDIDMNLVITPVGQTINRKYQWRLINLRQQLQNLNIDKYSMICSLLYHCTYDI